MEPKKQDRVRAAGIVLHNDSLLIMYRRRDEREYYTFPGGMVEEGESPEEAVVREVQEETTITVEVERLCYMLRWPDNTRRNARECFFTCTYKSGEPALAADSIERTLNEQANNQERNFFDPRWVPMADLNGEIPLFPTEVAARLFYDLKHGFQSTPVSVEGITIGG